MNVRRGRFGAVGCGLLLCAVLLLSAAEPCRADDGVVVVSSSLHRSVGSRSLLATDEDGDVDTTTEHSKASDTAKQLREAVPRIFGPDHFAVEVDYGKGIAAYTAFGLFFAAFVLVSFCCFCCCRVCCNRCGGKHPLVDGYTPKQRWGTFSVLLLFMLLSAAFGCVGLYYNEEFTKAVADPEEGMPEIVQRVIDTTLDLADYMVRPLDSLSNDTHLILNEVRKDLNDTSVIEEGVYGIVDKLHLFADNMNGLTVFVPGVDGAPNVTYICTYCTSVGDSVDDMSTEIDEKAGPTFDSMADTIANVRSYLLDVEDQITDYTGRAADELDSLKNKADSSNDLIDKISSDAKFYDSIRRIVMIVVFAAPFVTFVFIIVGGICKSQKILSFVYMTGFFFVFFTWIFFSVYLPLAMLTGDSCDYINEYDSNLEEKLPAVADVGNACLANTSLITAFNLTDKVAFVYNVSFPPLPDVSQSFNFTELDRFAADVDSLTLSTFNVTQSSWEPELQELNDLTDPDVWAVDDLESLDYNDYNDSLAVRALRASILTQYFTEIALNDTLTEMKLNVSLLELYVDGVKNDTANVMSSLDDTASLVDPLFAYARDILNHAYCGFIGDEYRNFKRSYCFTFVTSLAYLAMCCFFLPLFGTIVVILAIIVAKRLPHPEDGGPYVVDAHDPGETESLKHEENLARGGGQVHRARTSRA